MPDVGLIMQAIQANRQFQLQQQQVTNEKELREKEIEHQHDVLDEQKRLNDAMLKHQAASDALEHAKAKASLAVQSMSGMPIPGESVTPGRSFNPSGTQGPQFNTPGATNELPVQGSPTNTTQGNTLVHNIPLENGQNIQFEAPTPEAFAEHQAALQRITQKPAEEAKIAEETTRQEAETRRQVAVTKITQEEETKRQTTINALNQLHDTARQNAIIAGENYRTKLTTDTTRAVAMLPYSFMGGTVNDPQQKASIIQPYVEGLANGTMSPQQVQKDFNERGMQGVGTAVMSSFIGNGGVGLTDKQIQFTNNIKPIVDTLPLIQQYIDMLPKTTTGVGGMVSGLTHPNVLNPDLEAKFNQIEFNIATVAKNLSGDQGQRLQRALLGPAEGGFLPEKGKATTFNVSNYNRLINVLHSAVDEELSSIPVAQRAGIKNRLGLNNIPLLNLDGTSIREPVQPSTPAKGASGLSPAAIQLMKKHNIPLPSGIQ